MVISIHTVQFILTFTVAFVMGSLFEYWLHRLMHAYPQFFQFHVRHHLNNTAQGFLKEFRNYLLGASVIIVGPLFYAWDLGLGWLLGGISYAAFAAYAHQLQHDNPALCTWMAMPVHYVHHKYNQWHHNFGIGLDWWDRIFNTYQPVEWLDEQKQQSLQPSFLTIKWY